MHWFDIISLIGAIALAVYIAPQLIKTIKTKDTTSISLAMFLLGAFGSFLFFMSGVASFAAGNGFTPLITGLANLLTFSSSAVMAALKLINMHWAKKFQTTEKQFCENYESYRTKIKMVKAEKAAAKKAQKAAEEAAIESSNTSTPATPEGQ